MSTHQPSRRGSQAERGAAQRSVRTYRPEHSDEMEQIATELVLVAIATREGVSAVESSDQWCLAISSLRLALRLAVGSLSPVAQQAQQVLSDALPRRAS